MLAIRGWGVYLCMKRLFTSVTLAALLAACGGRNSSSIPSAPSSIATASLPGAQGANQVQQGYVLDTAFRPLAGVRVEVLDGPQAGTSMISDATGQFQLTGLFASTNTFRATREGYVPATQGFSTSAPGGRPWLFFYLKPLTPPVNIAGDYTLTFVADSACSDIPDSLRTRTYEATITGANPTNPADTSFQLTVRGAPLLEKFTGFTIGVAGDSLGFWLHGGHDPTLVEQLAASTYLAYSGWAEATVGTSAVSTISTPFAGWIDYCVMNSPMSAPYNCGTSNWTGEPIPGAAVEYAHCDSTNHRLILTRR